MSIIMTNSQNYTNIADAIRAKNGQSALYKPSEMAQAILNLPSGEIPGDPKLFDIFNHGTIVGLNPFCSVSSVVSNWHENESVMTRNDTRWEKKHYGWYDQDTANGPVLISGPVYNMDFDKVCFDCEVVPYSSSGMYNQYNLSYIGFMNKTLIAPTIQMPDQALAYATITPFDVMSPYLTNGEGSTFVRGVVKLSVPKITPAYYWPGFYNINSIMRVYSVWLE